jgi:hypothetical protein
MVVREIGVGARRAEVRIVRDHPLVMDTDALHPEADELSVEERPLQKPALVFDPLAREAGELGLRTTVSTGFADFGQDLARDPFSEAFRGTISRPSFTLRVSRANKNGKKSRVFEFVRRMRLRALSARSAQRTCTKGALVHVAVGRAFNPSRILSRIVSRAGGVSRILSRMVSRGHRAKKGHSRSRRWRGDSIPTPNR